jgi:predicted helicase
VTVELLGDLDRLQQTVEEAAAAIDDPDARRGYLNAVYEKLFRSAGPGVADTHGIVYTPEPIVRFMVRSVEDLLARELGAALGDEGVHVTDPFVGTGNFLLHVMQRIPDADLARKYVRELHGIEVLLPPFHIAARSIERAYETRTGEARPFPGLRLRDTFDPAPAGDDPWAGARVSVILGNPPYNAGQEDEGDRSPNRRYPEGVDRRIAETYARASRATLVNALGDPYVRAIRWASDHLGDAGVVAFVTNHSFLEKAPFDGMRRHLAGDFDLVYCLDLGGDVRRNPRLSGTTHNVFGVQVGICISFLVRRPGGGARSASIHHHRLDEFARREEKLAFLDRAGSLEGVPWRRLAPDARHTWITDGLDPGFPGLVPLGIKRRGREEGGGDALFRVFSNGPKSNNDAHVYGFSRDALARRAAGMVDAYEHARLHGRDEAGGGAALKWIRSARRHLARGHEARFDPSRIRRAWYRPFCVLWYFFDPCFNEDLYRIPTVFPTPASEAENRAIVVTGHSQVPFSCQMVSAIPCLDVGGRPSQCFPFYTYAADGSDRRENITDEALARVRAHHADGTIGKWDVFHHVYAILHHPAYRRRYEADLRRDLPRIPWAPDFWAFARAGRRLAEIHAGFEAEAVHPLDRIESPGAPRSWRVDRMRLDRTGGRVVYNRTLTLAGIPPEVFEHRVGSRSALGWVIDQQRVSTDPRSGIVRDPNVSEDPERIVRLFGRVISVSLETVRIVRALPPCEEVG